MTQGRANTDYPLTKSAFIPAIRLRVSKPLRVLKRFLLADTVKLEASSRCQLKCVVCPTAKGENRKGTIGWGDLTLESFERFVRINRRIRHVELSNWGEILLNPALHDILRVAHRKGIKLTANNGVNFNSVPDDTLEALAKYRFRSLTIALDGATPESYREYRRGGDFNRVIANIEKLNQFKRRHRSRYPALIWQFVIFGHNEHELDRARALARSLGMNFSPTFNAEGWGPQFSPVKDRDLVRARSGIGVASFTEFREKHRRELVMPCQDMWLSPQINWDGKMLGCCVNVWGDYGNVFASSLDECLASVKYRYSQNMLLCHSEERRDIDCVK
ncbi:MAG: radical SAM/SPASM domain-containing protein, partial [Candidatus Eiseniibacteriota bacterium]